MKISMTGLQLKRRREVEYKKISHLLDSLDNPINLHTLCNALSPILREILLTCYIEPIISQLKFAKDRRMTSSYIYGCFYFLETCELIKSKKEGRVRTVTITNKGKNLIKYILKIKK